MTEKPEREHADVTRKLLESARRCWYGAGSPQGDDEYMRSAAMAFFDEAVKLQSQGVSWDVEFYEEVLGYGADIIHDYGGNTFTTEPGPVLTAWRARLNAET